MSDDLTVRGGGSLAVATDGQLHLARVLVSLEDSCALWAARVETVNGRESGHLAFGPSLTPQPDANAGGEAAARAAVHLRRASEHAGRLGGQLVLSAESYGDVERLVGSLFEAVGAIVGWAFGASPGLLVLGALGITQIALTASFVRWAVGVFSAEAGQHLDVGTARLLRDLMATPAFVDAVRTVVSSTDDFLVGLGGAPGAVDALHRLGAGESGVAFAALMVAGGAQRLGIFPGSVPVQAAAVSHHRPGDSAAPRPPKSHEALLDRMPNGGEGSPQIRIERHLGDDGTEQWIVWTGGTIETGLPTDSTEPWDNQSNLLAVAGAAAESTEATRAAMALAGIPDGASVLHVGYSQGGIVAGAIAASGQYDSSVVTFGSPVETIPFPDDVPRTHIEHTEDLVPAFSGMRRESVEGGTVVRRSLYDGGAPPSGSDAFPAHSRDRYQETARLIDGSDDPRLVQVLEPLTGLTGGGESWEYRADRVG